MGESGQFHQHLAAIIVCLAALVFGTSLLWDDPMTWRLFTMDRVTITNELESWLKSCFCFGGLATTIILGLFSEKCSRKCLGYLIVLPFIISWILKFFAQNGKYLLAARFFVGCGGAGCLFFIPVYISETAGNTIRGTATSFLSLLFNNGILLSFIIGKLESFNVIFIISACFPILYLVCFFFLPETPAYLIRQNNINEAIKSLEWLKGENKTAVEQELAYLQDQVTEMDSTKTKNFFHLFEDRGTMKGLIIAIVLLTSQVMCGIFVMMDCVAVIFHLFQILQFVEIPFSMHLSTIIIVIIQLTGSFISLFLIERVGRKLLIIISCGLICICHIILGIYFHFLLLEVNLMFMGWIPVMAITIFIFAYCLGLGPVPFVIISEIFKPDIANLARSVFLSTMWIFLFFVYKSFEPLLALLGISKYFFHLAGICACTLIFVVTLMPETKGYNVESIFNKLNGTPNTKNKA